MRKNISTGRRVALRTETGTNFPGKVTSTRNIESGRVEVLIDGDPFPVEVDATRLSTGGNTMATKTRSAKELRQEAKALGIKGYSGMSKAELQEAVDTANEAEATPKKSRKSTTKAKGKTTKAKSSSKTKGKTTKKKSTPKEDADPGNPFRPNTNLWHIAEALKEGGKRKELTKKLKKKLEFNPRKTEPEDFNVEEQIDRRLKVVGYILKNDHGWDYKHEGRGVEAFIQATPPE